MRRRAAALRGFFNTLLALATALCLASCDAAAPPWQPVLGERVNLSLTMEERVEPPEGPRTWRRVELNLRGAWRPDRVMELRVEHVRVERQDADDQPVELVAGETPADATRLGRGDLTQLGVISALRGSMVSLVFDGETGLARIDGLDEALDAARPAGETAADAWAPLRRVFDAERWLVALRAAGMGEVPPRRAEQVSERKRRTPLDVPGRGATDIELTGRMAEEADGSPVLQLTGGVSEDASFTGVAEEVPAVLGQIALPSVEVRAETMYLVDAARPLRGNLTVRMQFAAGHELTEHVSFTLLVTR